MKTSSSAKPVLIAAIHFAYLNGGGEHYPLNLARVIGGRYAPEFLCGRDPFVRPRPLSREFPLHFVPCLYVLRHKGERTKGKPGLVLRTLHYFVYVAGAWVYLVTKGRRFRLVNTHDVISLQAAVWAKRLTGAKVVATLHGRPDRLEKRLLRKVDHVISVNESFKDELAAEGITHVSVVPTGFDPAIFSPGDKRDARKELGLEVTAKVVLFVGRMVPIKNVGHLLRAFSLVRKRVADVRLVLVGTGSLKGDLEAEARHLGLKGSVEFRPPVRQSDVVTYYRAADLFVLPSLSEAFPMVGVEALASGLPVLMTDNSPGFKRAFPEPTVLTVDPHDAAQTAARIEEALTRDAGPVVARQLELVEGYTWDQQGDKTVAVFNSLFK